MDMARWRTRRVLQTGRSVRGCQPERWKTEGGKGDGVADALKDTATCAFEGTLPRKRGRKFLG